MALTGVCLNVRNQLLTFDQHPAADWETHARLRMTAAGVLEDSAYVLVPQPYRRDGGKQGARYVLRTMPGELCRHPVDALSAHGSNQYGLRLRCMACDELLVRNGSRRPDSELTRAHTAAGGPSPSGPRPESRPSRDGDRASR